MKTLKIILAILLGWSAPIIVLGLWIWLMRTKKYEDFSIDRRAMWIVFGGILLPFALAIIVVAVMAVVEACSERYGDYGYDDSSYLSEYYEYSYNVTNVNFVSYDDIVESGIVQEGKQDIKQIYVSDVRSFVEALGSNRVIQIADNVELNLSEVLYDEEFFDAPGRLYVNDTTQVDIASSFVFSDTNYYARELTLFNLDNLTIRAAAGARIVVEEPDATVIEFVNCENVKMENLTFGHETEASCVGHVIAIDKCQNFNLTNCDLFGCGAYGLLAYESENVCVEKSVIRECTMGIMWLISCEDVTFKGSKFLRNDAFNLIEISGLSENILFENDVFEGNEGILFESNVPVYMKSCKITHDLQQLGDFSPESIVQLDNNTVLHPLPIRKNLLNQYLVSKAIPINTEVSQKLSDPDLIRRLIGTPDMPSFDTEAFEFIDADGNKVTLIKCKVNPEISDDEWDVVSTIADNDYYMLYGYGTLGTHYKRGWTVASNMDVPAGIAEEMHIDLQHSLSGLHEFYVQYHHNKGGREVSKEYLKDALYNMVGISVPDFEIVNYVRDYVVVLQFEDDLTPLAEMVSQKDGWQHCHFADEGDWNYYNKTKDWQVEIHADINVIKIKRHSWYKN